jgi:hypothetical protein
LDSLDKAVVDEGLDSIHQLAPGKTGMLDKFFGGRRAVVIEIGKDFIAFELSIRGFQANPHPREPGSAFIAEKVFVHVPLFP